MRKKEVLTTGQVAQLCHVAPRTVTKWFDSGQLHGYRIPGSKDRRIPLNELIRFMKAHDIPTENLETDTVRILLIDSRTEVARRFSDQLRMEGDFDVKCAHNSFDAGLMAVKYAPNVILIDLMSSDIDAGSLCSDIHDCDDIRNCRLVALAGGLGPREVENLQTQGFDAVVTDPANMNEVLDSIHQTSGMLQEA
jgi:excisionase family DNA binding protein